MDKEVYVDYVHKDSQPIGTYSMESKSLNTIHVTKLEETKVSIWGYELCNGAEWQDFLDVVNKLGEEIIDLEAKLEEKDEQIKRRVAVYEKQFIEQTDEIYKLKQQLAEKEHSIGMLNQHLTDKAIEIERLGEEIKELKTENMNIFEYSQKVEQQLAEKTLEADLLRVTNKKHADLTNKAMTFMLTELKYALQDTITDYVEPENVEECEKEISEIFDMAIKEIKGE